MTPWAQGKKAGSSPMPAVKKEALQVPEAVSTFVNEPLCRRDDSYASPEEYVEHVSLTGQHERSAAVSLIPLGDAWMAQLRSAPHLKPFETHSIGLAGEIQAVSHCSWTCSADPALARGVDCRLVFVTFILQNKCYCMLSTASVTRFLQVVSGLPIEACRGCRALWQSC